MNFEIITYSKMDMEDKKFKNWLDRAEWVAEQKGWGPLTDEDKVAIDDAVRMVTNLDL